MLGYQLDQRQYEHEEGREHEEYDGMQQLHSSLHGVLLFARRTVGFVVKSRMSIFLLLVWTGISLDILRGVFVRASCRQYFYE